MGIEFRLLDCCGRARAGVLATDHGLVPTPVFMPVGTQGAVKAASARVLTEAGVTMVLANAYHLYLRPGVETVESLGGLHSFMGWKGAVLTDSGGYQVLSLVDLRQVRPEGVVFRSHIDGSLHTFTPEKVIEIEARLGADVIMSFDYCTPYPCPRSEAELAVDLTTDWARRGASVYGVRFHRSSHQQVLFGVVQGSVFKDLRRRSATELMEIDFPGYALGGLSVGEEKERMWDIVEVVEEMLPAEKPRYLMGVGTPADVVEGIGKGIDMFDCVLPTRNARNGTVFTRRGKMVLKNACFIRDPLPIDEECPCYTCRRFSRGYLRHLFTAGEILGPILATIHSLSFYGQVVAEARRAVKEGDFASWKRTFIDSYRSGALASEREQ